MSWEVRTGSGQDINGGLNYRFYGDKLKVMSGVEYSDMNGGDEGGSSAGGPGFPPSG